MNMFKSVLLLCCVGFGGCTHIADLMACRPPVKGPDLHTDHVGWDHQSVEEVRCSNEELKAVQLAREKRESNSVVR